MKTFNAYVAAVCLVTVTFAIYDAPAFLRARQGAAYAKGREHAASEFMKFARTRAARYHPMSPVDYMGSIYSEAENRAADEWLKAIDECSKAGARYDVQKAYAILIGGVFLTHILLLGAVVLFRRHRSVTTSPSN